MAAKSRKKGLAMGFTSRQKESLNTSSNQLNSRLAMLQQGQEELLKEKQELESLRQQLKDQAPVKNTATLLPVNTLKLSGETQSRVHVNPEVVSEYMERMLFSETQQQVVDPEDKVWEPARVYAEKTSTGETIYWVADGFHRISAAQELGIERFQCDILDGSQRDAVRESLSANARHGLRRTRADKKRAVERALQDDEWRCWTDQRIADLCAVSRSMITRSREELEQKGSIPFEIALYGADGREFEREQPHSETGAVDEVVEHSVQQPSVQVVAKSVPKKKGKAVKSRATSATWKRVSKAFQSASFEAIVAYPEHQTHYEKLVEMLSSETSTTTMLCVPLLSGSQWFWKGPALLDTLTEHGFSQPEMIHIQSMNKHFVCWCKPGHQPEQSLVNAQNIFENLSTDYSVLLVGKCLDVWSI